MAILNQNNLKENVFNWFWVVLLISAVLYLRSLVDEMRLETDRLSEERKKAEIELKKSQEEMEKFQADFRAQIEESIEAIFKIMESKGQYPFFRSYR